VPCQDISCAGKGVGIEGKRSGLFFEIIRLVDELKPKLVFLENVPAIRTRGLDKVLQEFTERRYDCRWTMLSAKEIGALHKRERWFMLSCAPNLNDNGLWEATANKEEKCEWRSEASVDKCSSDPNTNSAIGNDEQRADERSGRWDEADRHIEHMGESEFQAPNDGSERIQGQWIQPIYRLADFSWCKDVRRIEDLRNRPNIPEPLIRREDTRLRFRVDRVKSLGNACIPIQAKEAFKELVGI
jgi:DNA (cytosine-5)-methyltransferase 1